MSRALLVLHNSHDRDRAIHWIKKAPPETRVEFKAAKRSLDQNALMWAALTDIAQQIEHLGKRYTPDEWKILFMHACGREVRFLPGLDGKTFVPWGQSSSDLSKQEMSELIDFIFSWGAERGVMFHDHPSINQRSDPESPKTASGGDAGNGAGSVETPSSGSPAPDNPAPDDGNLSEAHARAAGAEHRAKGMARKAVPAQFRKEPLLTAFHDGFDTGVAEDREPGAEG